MTKVRKQALAFTFAISGIVGLLSTLTPAAAFAESPITSDNRPTALANQTNGAIASSELINVAPNCRAHRAAAPSLALLLKSARLRGINISTSECYRPLNNQVAVAQSWTNAGNSACAAPVTRSPSGTVVGTSIHGWGKAADLGLGGGFESVAYKYLKSTAGAYGWNHPAFAEPGGSACPEPWHWEWVGDGGTKRADAINASVIGLVPGASDNSYTVVDALGGIALRGNANDYGSASNINLNWLVVGAATTPTRHGYWMVGADGGVFGFGDAGFYGSTGAMKLNQPVVSMTPTPTGLGYWTIAADGGVFSFGDAAFFGSTGSMRLNRPVVASASTPSGKGYWTVASDGGIFSFGDAAFHGSTGAMRLNKPMVAMATTPSGGGYWLVAEDGGVFCFGDAKFFGSSGATPPTQPIVAMTRTTTGNGYWLTVANGDVIAFGDAKIAA